VLDTLFPSLKQNFVYARYLFVPSSQSDRFVSEVVSTLTLADTGQGPILLYPADWKQHFQPMWGELVSAKHRYDPDNIFLGQGIFL
jgi:hypothetical protein